MQPIELTGFVILCGLFAGMTAYGVVKLAADSGEAQLRRRLRDDVRAGGESSEHLSLRQRLSRIAVRIGHIAATPFLEKDEQADHLRRDLVRAGVYAPSAPKVITGMKVLLLGSGLGVGYGLAKLGDTNLMLSLSMGGIIGYLLPRFWLKQKIASHQRDLDHALPDALDLMVVCVEAGLTLDSAMQRVGEELALAHPGLAREMTICHIETRIGLPRTHALRNLGTRTGNQSLQALAAMLIQADRFGTSIGQALRVQGDGLRERRRFAAEEAAGKASVKMSFPLVLFIFPASFLVLAGPAVLKLLRSSFME